MKKFVLFIGLAILLVACQTTPASQATTAFVSTNVSVPLTNTPEPTATPIPPTPTVPPPLVLSNNLSDVKEVNTDNFDTDSGWSTYNPQTGKVSNGVYEITGQPGWMSGLVRDTTFKAGQGIMLEFKYAKGTTFELILDTGEWQTDSYRRFGIYGFGIPRADLIQGKNGIGYNKLSGNFTLKPDTWYDYMSGVGYKGDFIALIWDPSAPTKVIKYRETIGDKWEGLSWQFTAKAANTGMTLDIDNFAEISFSAIK